MTVSKKNIVDNVSSLKQQWTAGSIEELNEEFRLECLSFHPMGYGTRMYNIMKDEFTMMYSATFYRFKSCD
jgi:hypothetical protein